MLNSELKEQVQDILRMVLRDDTLDVFPEMTAADVVGYDSLAHITIIIEIETKFGVSFSTREVMGFANVGEMMDCLAKHLDDKA